MTRAAMIPATTAHTPVASVAARTSITPGTYQTTEESAPKTEAPAITQVRIGEA